MECCWLIFIFLDRLFSNHSWPRPPLATTGHHAAPFDRLVPGGWGRNTREPGLLIVSLRARCCEQVARIQKAMAGKRMDPPHHGPHRGVGLQNSGALSTTQRTQSVRIKISPLAGMKGWGRVREVSSSQEKSIRSCSFWRDMCVTVNRS